MTNTTIGGTMTSHLNSAIAAEHTNDLIAEAQLQRLARAVRDENRNPSVIARFAAALRGGEPSTPQVAPQAPACQAPVRS